MTNKTPPIPKSVDDRCTEAMASAENVRLNPDSRKAYRGLDQSLRSIFADTTETGVRSALTFSALIAQCPVQVPTVADWIIDRLQRIGEAQYPPGLPVAALLHVDSRPENPYFAPLLDSAEMAQQIGTVLADLRISVAFERIAYLAPTRRPNLSSLLQNMEDGVVLCRRVLRGFASKRSVRRGKACDLMRAGNTYYVLGWAESTLFGRGEIADRLVDSRLGTVAATLLFPDGERSVKLDSVIPAESMLAAFYPDEIVGLGELLAELQQERGELDAHFVVTPSADLLRSNVKIEMQDGVLDCGALENPLYLYAFLRANFGRAWRELHYRFDGAALVGSFGKKAA